MSYRERTYLVLTNQEGKTARFKIPVYLNGFDPEVVREQIESILDLGILLDTRDCTRYLVTCKEMTRVEVIKRTIFDKENPFAVFM
ncbi:hypothetical protein [uncultured Vagococcus sp.]|uniref:hypothetical protein n=1 Tax=uncultured Vagococcus sp. TaxID=189676 RepID=UPI0028D73206|nr:hypothetical protein [uncultured Vagococcus sp.]